MSLLLWLVWLAPTAVDLMEVFCSVDKPREKQAATVPAKAPPAPRFPESKQTKATRVSYAIADLIAPDGDGSPEALIEKIQNTVAPASWSRVGGPGTINYYPLGMALVIHQTTEIQEQVDEFLTKMRRQLEQGKEYVLEIKLFEAQREGEPKSTAFPKITVFKDRWFKLFVGKTVTLKHGSIQDLAPHAAVVEEPAADKKAEDMPDEVQVGFLVRGKVTLVRGKMVRLDMMLQNNELESASRDDIVVVGSTLRTAQRLRLGEAVRQVLDEDPDGEPFRWVEIVVRENLDE